MNIPFYDRDEVLKRVMPDEGNMADAVGCPLPRAIDQIFRDTDDELGRLLASPILNRHWLNWFRQVIDRLDETERTYRAQLDQTVARLHPPETAKPTPPEGVVP